MKVPHMFYASSFLDERDHSLVSSAVKSEFDWVWVGDFQDEYKGLCKLTIARKDENVFPVEEKLAIMIFVKGVLAGISLSRPFNLEHFKKL